MLVALYTAACDISIHSPHTGRDAVPRRSQQVGRNFNPLSPHGERLHKLREKLRRKKFQSTLPTRGETYHKGQRGYRWQGFQSTLPTRGETTCSPTPRRGGFYFNPLSPHGERHCGTARRDGLHQFQSTLPTRGETAQNVEFLSPKTISIHSPHTGRDTGPASRTSACGYFNPLSPHGERPSPECAPA